MLKEFFKFPFQLMMHPFNHFWEMKYESKGNSLAAGVIISMLILVTLLQEKYNGFIVNFNMHQDLNSIDILKFVLLPFVLWCIANWSLTTLMDGEGTFRDIVWATAYSLLPLVVIGVPQLMISRYIIIEESAFFHGLTTLSIAWFLWLLFIGMMTVHQYSVIKTIVTLFLTLVVIGFILFLGLLAFSLIQQMASFVITVYQELIFRI